MNLSRRRFLSHSALFGASAATLTAQAAQQHSHHGAPPNPNRAETAAQPRSVALNPAVLPAAGPLVEAPDLAKMPWAIENGVKVFRITAEPVKREFLPGKLVDCWGFNGSMPGPVIELVEGDRVRFIVENRLPEVFSMHWHGLEVPVEMDGVPGLHMDPIAPGGSFAYEFTVHQHGTFFYHSHMPMQEMLGLIGLMVIHPKEPYRPRVDRDFGLIFQEWAILPNNSIPNTLSMEFNWLTINGKAGPDATPMLVKQGERVRIRLVNIGMDHHPFIFTATPFMSLERRAGACLTRPGLRKTRCWSEWRRRATSSSRRNTWVTGWCTAISRTT